MTRWDRILLILLLLELAAGIVWLSQRRRVIPPLPDLSSLDTLAARQIRELAQVCRAPEDWQRLAEAYLINGFFPEAEACYRHAAEELPENAELAQEWAFSLEYLGRTAEANVQYERAIQTGHPRPAECWYMIGRNLLRQEKPEEARTAFSQAGRQAAARYELARLYAHFGEYREALQLLVPLLSEAPGRLQPHLLRHRIAILQGDADTAALHAELAGRAFGRLFTPFDREWQRLTAGHKRYGLLQRWLASKELIAARRPAEAEPLLREGLEIDWQPIGADLLADVELDHGRGQEAVRLLQQIIELDGPSIHSLERLGDAYVELGQADQARASWERAATLGSGAEVKDVHHKLAFLLEKAGKMEESRWHYAQACCGVGIEAFWNDKLDEAHMALAKAVELDPRLAHAWFYLGETYRLRDQTEACRQAYERCLEIDPNHGRCLASLARLGRRASP